MGGHGHGHHGGHHGGGGRRRRAFGGRLGSVDVVDYIPEAIELDCYWERLPDGRMVRRCPPRVVEASGPGASYLRYSEAMGEAGDILPTIVTASTATSYIDETDVSYNTMDQTITKANVPPEFLAAWKATFIGWKAYAATARPNVSFFTAKSVMEQTDRWVQTLAQFSTQFHQLSPNTAVPTPNPPGQGVADPSVASFLSGSTGLILAGAALAGVLIFGRMSK